MKAIELSKTFDPKSYEGPGLLVVDGAARLRSFPRAAARLREIRHRHPLPNVTGVLHMGHGLNNSLQDIVVRYHRMIGEDTLWVPGCDHAGIATQHVVEKMLKKQGTSRHDLGREKFVEETWKVTHEHHDIIVKQLKRLGSSCDWERERFTLDEGLSRAVREVFVSLYEKGLIYRGYYLVNWCPTGRTAISDDEVEHVETKGKLWHYRYPLADGSGSITSPPPGPRRCSATPRLPSTPKTSATPASSGRWWPCRSTGREIPIIADAQVEREFGTGAVKVTPAHDPVDNEIGHRHSPAGRSTSCTPDGKLNDNVPEPYRGLPVLKARAKVVEDIKAAGSSSRKKTTSTSGPLLPVQHRDRALPLGPVVREDAAARGQGR